ncbi:MAG: SH3 domain-containing protein, partial [Chloroflexi bacterium]|nr:SH3 domain-containing protein [Chloroflexota bacterium]
SPTLLPAMCIQVVQSGDTLLDLIFRCGYDSLDRMLLDTILEMNNMNSAAELVIGQEVMIPWPAPDTMPTPGPTFTSTPIPTATSTPTITPTAEVLCIVFVTGSNAVNLRAQPSIASSLVFSVPLGGQLEVLGQAISPDDGLVWYRVRTFVEDSVVVGWVRADVVTQLTSAPCPEFE